MAWNVSADIYGLGGLARSNDYCWLWIRGLRGRDGIFGIWGFGIYVYFFYREGFNKTKIRCTGKVVLDFQWRSGMRLDLNVFKVLNHRRVVSQTRCTFLQFGWSLEVVFELLFSEFVFWRNLGNCLILALVGETSNGLYGV